MSSSGPALGQHGKARKVKQHGGVAGAKGAIVHSSITMLRRGAHKPQTFETSIPMHLKNSIYLVRNVRQTLIIE